MSTPFDSLNALHQMQPTAFDALDANMAFRSDSNAMANRDDAKLFVKFYTRPVRNDELTAKEGRVIHEDKLFINIKIPGDKNNDVNRIAFPEDIQRFPQHFQRFKDGQEQVIGTPLSVVPFLTESQVEDYRTVHIRTVEQLAMLSDGNAQKILGAVSHKQQAQEFLDKMKNVDTLREEFDRKNKERDAEIEELRAQLAALQSKE